MVSLGIEGAVWRAAFVAALAIVAFALTRYWQSLSEYARKIRYPLVGLRAVTLLLVALAFVGATIQFKTQMPLQILNYRMEARQAKDDSSLADEETMTKRVSSLLNVNGIELVEKNDIDWGDGSSQDSVNTAAAIFVTDGALLASAARDEIEHASIASGGGPVFVITGAQDANARRVAVESVAVTSRPVRGVPLSVRCLVHARGMRGHSTLVAISDDAEVRSSGQVRWALDDERQVLILEVVPKTAGWINYLVRAEAAGSENSTMLSRPLAIYAEERRQRIFFLEGEPTWEAKFIRRALDNADLFEVDYFAQVSRAATVGIRDPQAGASTEAVGTTETGGGASPAAKLRGVLASATRLNSYDCIIVGATPDGLLSNVEASRLRNWVERRGGGLIILGGNNFAGSIVGSKGKLGSLMPALVDSGAFRSESQTLSLNAPVEAEKSRGSILLTPTNAGHDGALRGYATTLGGNTRSGGLSGDGLRVGALRPGASVLAVSGQPGENGTSEEGAPLVTAMRYGAGRTLLFAPNDSWRMRTNEGGDQSENAGPFVSLWQGMVLWTASGARPPVEIVMSDESPAVGREVTLELRVRDESYLPETIRKLRADLQSVSDTAEQASPDVQVLQEIPFLPDRNDAGVWRARFAAPPSGRYNLQIKYTANGKSGSVEKYFASVARSLLEPGSSRDTLSRVSRETGGDIFDSSALSALPDRLASLPQTKQVVSRVIELRSLWVLAFIIPFLLSCEWLAARIREKGERSDKAIALK